MYIIVHPLDGAYLRLSRASEHTAEFQRLERDFWEAHEEPFKIDFETQPEIPRIELKEEARAVPPFFSVIVGEAIYNLRAALDYLVFELAKSDAGCEQQGTQFPLDDKAEVFAIRQKGDRRGRGAFLRGVSDLHVAAIERLQPYHGCEWTKTLRNISNSDKHRKLTVAKGHTYGGAIVHFDLPDGWNPPPEWRSLYFYSTGKVLKTRDPGGRNVSVYYNLTPFVSFSDGLGVALLLLMLQRLVTYTLDSFHPEIKV